MNPKQPVPPFHATRRATHWQLRTRQLELPRRPLLMGIVNVTPDSFSDGGKYFDPRTAVDQALRLAAEGADLIDIGGESTRPYSTSVSADEQLRRVIPVLDQLAGKLSAPISIDTMSAMVAGEALGRGVEIINDISGLLADPEMMALAVRTGAGVCAMHIQGTPQTMQDDPRYADVVTDVFDHLSELLTRLTAAGIEPGRIALDPGIGFGKTHQHNVTLLAHCYRFHELGCSVLVGHSRKGFIGKLIGDADADRTPGTIGVALALARQGVQIIRVHDVAAVRQALILFEAVGGLDDLDVAGP
jgi:dihydropteroate synthase